MRRAFAFALAPALAALAACSQDVTPAAVRNLDRPTDMVFACYGDLTLDGGEVTTGAMPIAQCLTGDQEGPDLFGIVLQSATGTVALVKIIRNGPPSVVDSDPLTPGKNSTPIGSLPVGLAASPAGCHAISANAGSCDLSVLDVAKAIQQEPAVSRLAVTNAAGARFRSVPRDIVGPPAGGEPGVVCEEHPTGLVYVAYPACNLVAGIDMTSGQIVTGIRFAADGTASIATGDVANDAADCPGECGEEPAGLPAGGAAAADAGAADAGAPPAIDPGGPRPIALHMAADGGRLYIGAERLAAVTIVDLDADLLPSAVEQVRLEGDVGITALAATGDIEMGGGEGIPGGSAGTFRFAYAVATDRTVRVIDVNRLVECDTQVDPRFLHDATDAGRLACLEVGAPDTPPRRLGARSPGIHMPRDQVPLDVGFFTLAQQKTDADGNLEFDELGNPVFEDPGEPAPATLVGTFALITTSGGFGYLGNIDDDNYPDTENSDDPLSVFLPMALPHQLRDSNTERDKTRDATMEDCLGPDPDASKYGPRLLGDVGQAVNAAFVATDKAALLPRPRRVECSQINEMGTTLGAVPELSYAAPLAVRENAFPDLAAVQNERWSFTWEGKLSLDSARVDVDGPSVRLGVVERSGGAVAVRDASAPFCAMGAQPFDIAHLVGCQNDLQCGVGETCFFHPDQPSIVDSGICMPAADAQSQEGPCRDFMVARRRYSILATDDDKIQLGERRRRLRTTPLDGCDSDEQCGELAVAELELLDAAPPADILTPPEVTQTFACENDPTRAPGPPACMMTCQDSAQCDAGAVCSKGHCVEGLLPPAQCVGALQRYEVLVGDAFAVVGRADNAPGATGFLHHRIAGDGGQCIDDPDASPLAVGRLPLRAPPCAGDGLTDFDPNPCSTTVAASEERVVYEEDAQGAICSTAEVKVVTRDVPAIRFSNPVFTMHMVGISTNDDHRCLGDEGGDLPAFSPVYSGYTITMELTGGFIAAAPLIDAAAYPVEVVTAPDGSLWVLDQGDVVTGTLSRGRLIHVIPGVGDFATVTVL